MRSYQYSRSLWRRRSPVIRRPRPAVDYSSPCDLVQNEANLLVIYEYRLSVLQVHRVDDGKALKISGCKDEPSFLCIHVDSASSFLNIFVSQGAFSALADNRQKQRPKPLTLVLLAATNEEDKANQFVTEIKELTQTRGYQYKNIAIRYPS